MGEIPGWMREELRVAGWVVVESLETFDVHLGDRFANRALALQKAISGDALLASNGKVAVSSDLSGDFLIGRLRQSAKPITTEDETMLVYTLDSVERHTRASTSDNGSSPAPGASRATRAWTCPRCGETWQLLEHEPSIPEDPTRCPECAEAPGEFSPGQVVRVRQIHGARTRLGVVDEPVQAEVLLPDGGSSDAGPYTGEYMVWHLSSAYGSPTPADPDVEREVFSALPRDPARRRSLASHIMMGSSATPEQIQALEPEEEGQLSGA